MQRMRTLWSSSCLILVACGLVACGPSTAKPDAGPDTSCGLDCAAQARFGLLENRCFEYSSDPLNKQDPPALGAWVRPVFTLEGGVKVMPVEYRQSGQIRMIDRFGIVNGELLLMRREFSGSGQSVTYRTGEVIAGVKWLAQDTGVGENFSTATSAFVVNQAGVGETTATSYRVTTAAASTSELRTPLSTFPSGLKVLPGETPDHGSDTRRVFVPDVGFVVIASSFTLIPGTSLPLAVQRIRDPGTPDGGAEDCSLGSP
jgi:hypothetical protein